MGLITSALAALLLATQIRAADPQSGTPVEAPAAKPTLNAPTVHGCFSSSGSLTSLGTLTFNSIGGCAKDTCFKNGKKVGGTSNGAECYCGDTYPPLDTLVEDSKCDIPCTGYPFEVCGGLNYYTIYNTGVALGVPYDANGTAPSGSPSSSPAPNPPTDAKGQPTVVVTAPPPGTPQTQSGSGGSSSPNVGGIVAGVVVGLAVVFGIAGGIFFFLRRRRNKEIEEEHRHNAAVNAFINGSKPPGSSGGVSVSDARLDPVMAQRRMSSGSIADNADYSRKILRVRTPSSSCLARH